MDAAAQARAMGLLGRFNDDLTRVFDAAFGSRWAEIETMVALSAIAAESHPTTRRLAAITRMNRRAVSRMLLRMREEGLVTTRPSHKDRRAVEVVFTPDGERRAEVLRTSIVAFFLDSAEIAHEISAGLASAEERFESNTSSDAMPLLLRVCEAGVNLVRTMPDAASQGHLAARQRAALVQIASMGGVRPHDLATSLAVSRPAASYIVDQLCAKGYAVRLRDVIPEDRRAVVVQVTPEGMSAVQAVMRGIAEQSASLARLFAEVAAFEVATALIDERTQIPGR
ncbi:DNA-binding MarR family transcriptional regulator [Microbacterium sp. AK009]|uniref:MarR family transcriptional regulator n=1 Tax=Microbacterium sp. AK009 TaxID=2723068 RepID=UPI0015C84D20|nr:MarR family transcriptional regulator [Microbacterium sp. AK009]NYF16623.1 DNA-binding MarR family transcriptional regulator [Microbacterium sp. AK009]